jgi:hypothetical protein
MYLLPFSDKLNKLSTRFERKAKIALITLTISMNMQAQQNFGSYLNKIFFNVFSTNPDSSIHKFLNDFVPVLLHPPENNATWSVYPPGDITPPVIITHSYIFHKHPFIDAAIKQGEFKVYTTVFDDLGYHNATGIKDIQVILGFEKLDDATKLFEEFRKDLKALGREHFYDEDKSRRFSVVYSQDTMYNIPSKVQILLVTHAGFDDLYQLSISIN